MLILTLLLREIYQLFYRAFAPLLERLGIWPDE